MYACIRLLIKSNRTSFRDIAPTRPTIRVGQSDIPFSDRAKNLGVTHSPATCQWTSMLRMPANLHTLSFAVLITIGSIRHFLTVDAAETLVCAFVLSKLDYCNSLLSGSPQHSLDKLQKVKN